MILVVLAGLPGSGKSALARALAPLLGAHVFDKDRVREALFGPDHVSYSREQDDLCVHQLLDGAAFLARSQSRAFAILDGRTFARSGQVAQLEAWSRERHLELAWIECRVGDEIADSRLAQDARSAQHLARDRGSRLRATLAVDAAALPADRLVLHTDGASPTELAETARAWLSARVR